MRDICPIGNKYVKTGVQCGYCQRQFHVKCENTIEAKVYPAEQQCICMQDQHQKFENTLQCQHQKQTEEIKEMKEKFQYPK